MKAGVLTLLIIGLIQIFAAPYVDWLTPSDAIWLVDKTIQNETKMLAQGANTLWYQWQSWGYIYIFLVITALTLGTIYNKIRTISDVALIEAKLKLEQKTEEMEKIKREYRDQIEQEVQNKHSQESKQLNLKAQELHTIQTQIEIQKVESHENLKKANHVVRRQQQETQSKLGQRDRLRQEKKRIAEFLEKMDWKFTDGRKITYTELSRLAKEHKKY
ncbi:hypothetical protein R3X26_18605 [Vibrio sp. TH_r3]|uniref:hypothetical protein n=1 Tax=Vibrio sp. TH_r3 TaxID=3082084 RepID=UPI002955120C|nr:hypothetical protein [Vibrio sp. TH_r3]MDV7106395.1 hypothetical protein [Vibrio sp. TH_r3]